MNAVKSFNREESLEIRDALESDSGDLAFLVNLAGDGIPAYLWKDKVEGDESPLDVGARRAAREDGSFSYRNARACVENDVLLGMMLSYRQPDPYEIGDLSELPDVVRPLVELEAGAPGSWYINAIATFENHRGKGVARLLIEDAERQARSDGCDRLSLIVASENPGAKRLYEKLGYRDIRAKQVIRFPGFAHGGDWVLMVKKIAAARAAD